MMTLWAAMAAGFLGSLHCATMCGPLLLAGCRKVGEGVGYFLGRAVSYSMMGAVMGELGHHALCRLHFSTVQEVALALMALLAAWRGLRLIAPPTKEPLVQLRSRRSSAAAWRMMVSLLPNRGLGLGLATALLPCGLLASAWLLAASTESALHGAAVMLAFGVASSVGLLATLLGAPMLRALALRLPRAAQATAWLLLAAFIASRPLWVAAHCKP